jgi:hypothetical protein
VAWLTRDDQVLATFGTGGVRLVRGPALVHTLGAAEPLDVAWCNQSRGQSEETLEVRRIATVGRFRVARPCLPGHAAVCAPAGAFERWKLQVGDRLEVTGP